MRSKWIIFIIVILWLYSCSDDPYPVYDEGEIIWQVTEQPVLFVESFTEPLMAPDTKQIVFRSAYAEFPNKGRLVVHNLDTGLETVIAQFGYNADISPDGEWVAFNSSYGVISKIKLNGDSLSAMPLVSISENFAPAWGPDNQLSYFHGSYDKNEQGGIFVYDNDSSNKFITANGPYSDFFPDGKRIISSKKIDQSIWTKFLINDIIANEELSRLDASVNEDNRNPKVSPDGNQILYWNGVGIYIMQSDGTKVRLVLPGRHFYEGKQGDNLGFLAFSPSWHPDGKHIIYQHFAITEYIKCPDFCLYSELIYGIVSIWQLRVN
ncbi:MAG: PD40 domain-containing protein [Cyclobacteriaceae bacterium]|nr:PD40 domain-containing protein [Cyclobacteriaceae bacterium]